MKIFDSRFFYQSLQETRLKISVTPQSRAAGEPVQVNTSQLLAIKVEGVIERSGIENKQSRKVSADSGFHFLFDNVY